MKWKSVCSEVQWTKYVYSCQLHRWNLMLIVRGCAGQALRNWWRGESASHTSLSAKHKDAVFKKFSLLCWTSFPTAVREKIFYVLKPVSTWIKMRSRRILERKDKDRTLGMLTNLFSLVPVLIEHFFKFRTYNTTGPSLLCSTNINMANFPSHIKGI